MGAGGEAPAGRILIVEDDVPTSRFLVRALERAGFEASAASDVPEASELLQIGHWDALLVDIGLPGRSGFDLLAEVKVSHPDLPIALTTADASMDVAVKALRSEVDDFLPKPIEPEVLVRQVERLIERRRSTKRDTERVLAIGAHPDDVEIGVGATLLRHHQDGDEIVVLTLSRGARGGDQDSRAKEAVRAAEQMGARLILEDLPDTAIPENNPTVAIIESVVAHVDPTIVYVHSVHDTHQDHRNVHHAALSAVRRVPNVYCYQSPTAKLAFHPLRFVAIDAFIDGKLSVIATYESQASLRWYLDPELLRSTARYWGRFGDSRYCEPLEIERERSRRRASVAAAPDDDEWNDDDDG